MTKSKMPLTLARVNELLTYCPTSGEFRWRISTTNSIRIGQVAGTVNAHGYRVITIDGRLYKAHRLAWFVSYGVWPTGEIDHKKGRQGDNPLANLREATRTQNAHNRGICRNNTSGVRGVSFHKQRGRWNAQICVAGKRINLGLFDTLDQASAARIAAEKEHFGEFARTNL